MKHRRHLNQEVLLVSMTNMDLSQTLRKEIFPPHVKFPIMWISIEIIKYWLQNYIV